MQVDPLQEMCTAENTLHRYYYWAYKTYRLFVDEREKNRDDPDAWMYLSLWFAQLYVAVEGWQELKLADAEIETLLANTTFIELLRRYRNGVCHFQKKYWDHRFDEMVSVPETAAWAEELLIAFGAYFKRRIISTNHPALRSKVMP